MPSPHNVGGVVPHTLVPHTQRWRGVNQWRVACRRKGECGCSSRLATCLLSFQASLQSGDSNPWPDPLPPLLLTTKSAWRAGGGAGVGVWRGERGGATEPAWPATQTPKTSLAGHPRGV